MSIRHDFRFWVRKGAADSPTFSIRFEVRAGKGLLRIARPGVLVDPPARQSGYEERLTPSQVRASRFLHVWEGGKKRQGYVLSRLTDDLLGELEEECWRRLVVVSEGGFCWLVPGLSDEDTSPSEELTDMDMPIILDEDEGSPESTSPLKAPDDAAGLFGKATTLVRFMRREKARDESAIAELEGRIAELEVELEDSRQREIGMRDRLARYERRLKARESAGERD